MRRCGVVVVLFGVVLISGCSAATDATDTGETNVSEPVASETTPAEPAAFHFDSGDLIIGPFNPEEVKHNLFDPCTEISDAEFAAAGLAKSDVQPGTTTVQFVKGCSVETNDPYKTILLVTNAADKNIILASSPELGSPISEPPESFAYGSTDGSDDMCDVAVETDRGTFSVSIGTLKSGTDADTLCEEAGELLNRLFVANNL